MKFFFYFFLLWNWILEFCLPNQIQNSAGATIRNEFCRNFIKEFYVPLPSCKNLSKSGLNCQYISISFGILSLKTLRIVVKLLNFEKSRTNNSCWCLLRRPKCWKISFLKSSHVLSNNLIQMKLSIQWRRK